VKMSAISTVDGDGMSPIPATSIVFGFFTLSCAMAIGFVSALENGGAHSTDYGYWQPMESAAFSPPSSAEGARCDVAHALTSRKQLGDSNDAASETRSSLADEIAANANDAPAIRSSARLRNAPQKEPKIAD
jgi:hypothetical protein